MNSLPHSGAKPMRLPDRDEALPGRDTPIPTSERHLVTGLPLKPPFPEGSETAMFGLGSFWAAERLFWRLSGVLVTAVGYAGGLTPNPTYEEVATGLTGHAEVVLVVFDPARIGYDDLLKAFWEAHDPTQGMRQGNDVGTQYRSAIFTEGEAQAAAAARSRDRYEAVLAARRFEPITTEIRPAPPFYWAEAKHQQYLARHPDGYCGLRGTGIACPSPGGTTP